jgi:hypothetical protein
MEAFTNLTINLATKTPYETGNVINLNRLIVYRRDNPGAVYHWTKHSNPANRRFSRLFLPAWFADRARAGRWQYTAIASC